MPTKSRPDGVRALISGGRARKSLKIKGLFLIMRFHFFELGPIRLLAQGENGASNQCNRRMYD